jgi:hypothetical protein
MSDAPKFLFVPVSGPAGTGEYYRSLAVAGAVGRRWPGCAIRFVLSRDASYGADSPFPVLPVDRSPTYETRAVVAILERERPDVVVFDSSGRVAQYRRARQLGARVVYVSSRATTRRKGFRLRRMRFLDQHWLVAPEFAGVRLGFLDRLRLKLAPGCEVLGMDVLHEPPDGEAARDLQRRIGVEPGRYVLVCPGGGGLSRDGADVAGVYYAAAREVAGRSGLAVIAVLGPRFAVPPDAPPGVHVLPSLSNAVLMGLLRDAELGLVNGGSLLIQALELGTPCVAAPVADDQPARIAACAARGLVRPGTLDQDSLLREATALLDPAIRQPLESRIEALGLRNGLDSAIAALERLVD